ncbi:hypothetical protein, partial [Helicobacter jaachi]|uniref:hypothetical protein n=1 Tax=Helicobacter jaachi TaxID=1677920 RepID=UPI001EE8BA9F
QAKNMRLQDIYKASDKLMNMLTQNPYLENFFSLDKYRETYQGAKETLERERLLRGKTHLNGKS